MEGWRYGIKAHIHSISGYLAQAGLARLVTGMKNCPSRVRIVHGGSDAKRQLAQVSNERHVKVGRELEVFILG